MDTSNEIEYFENLEITEANLHCATVKYNKLPKGNLKEIFRDKISEYFQSKQKNNIEASSLFTFS